MGGGGGGRGLSSKMDPDPFDLTKVRKFVFLFRILIPMYSSDGFSAGV